MNDFIEFLRNLGLTALLILGACFLGIFNPGWIPYELTSITLFIFIAVVYIIFHLPALWRKIKNLWSKLLNR